jgi:phytoene synthase
MNAPAIEIEHSCRRCEQITRAEAANFYYGIRLLPREKRWAMSAVYAFARRVDDIGDDGSLGAEAQRAALSAEREMLEAIAADRPTDPGDPVGIALGWAGERYALPIEALTFLVEGVEFDVEGRAYETFADLVAYCRRVAGAVGRLCVAIFADGQVTDEMDALADDLGIAMQLTTSCATSARTPRWAAPICPPRTSPVSAVSSRPASPPPARSGPGWCASRPTVRPSGSIGA